MRWIERLGIAAALLLPLFLLHGRALAEILLTILGVLFLVHSALARDWAWVRAAWVRIGIAWWIWVVGCTLTHGAGPLLQALASVRFLLLVAALEAWVLRSDTVRRWFATLLRWSAYYLAVQCLVQFATGRSLFGWPRGADGELTGPYENPRAGAPLSRLLFPAILPRIASTAQPWLGALLLVAGVATMVLIGQRMPLLLTFMGLFVTALFLPRLRGFVMAACIAAGLVLSASPIVAPRTFNRLVTKFSSQMEHFEASHYGLIARRAVEIAKPNPILGVGFDGFRRECENPAYFHGIDVEGGGAAMCVQHPHNFYLQALVEGGIPGLILFAALAAAWLARLLRGLWRTPAPLRVGLFAACLMHLWPIASTTAFTSMPQGGWFFVLLGLGLAEARPHIGGRTHKVLANV